MKKSFKKLLGSLWLVCFGVMPLCIVGETFAGDNDQRLTCTAYTSAADTDMPRRRMLLGSGAGTRKSYTYYGSSSSNSGDSNTTMIFVGDPQDIIVDSAKVVMRLHWSRIDEPDFVPPSTTPAVSFNGVSIGHMTKLNSKTQNDEFIINPSLINFNDYNTLWHEGTVNNPGSGSWASVTIEGVVKRINLQASSNLDDSIKLSWDTSSGMSGVRYYIDRRGSPTEQFKCLNKDNPTQDRHYYDRTCMPGVKYYYRIRSESGIESNEVVGKRVAKTVEPKFQFTLTGTDRPLEIGALGLNGERDVLVAGHAFWCEIALTDIVPSDIKYIRLVGYPAGGAASQKRHNIICFNGNDGSFFDTLVYLDRDWMFGRVVPSEGNTFKFAATLKSGKGYHGKYNWSIVCEYEINGKVSYETVADVSKPVYFEKYGTDNGDSVDSDITGGILDPAFWRSVPNWFAYWRDDGACPSLKDNEYKVYYRGKKGTYRYGGSSNSGETDDSKRIVELDYNAADNWGPSAMRATTINNKTFFTWDGHNGGREVSGIYMVEDIVAHETQHHKTAIRYNLQKGTKKDSDKQEGMCIFQSDTTPSGTAIAECKNLKKTHEISDSIVDEDEINDFFRLKEFFGSSFQGTAITNVDTYALSISKNWEYGAYGDNELVSMVAGRLGVRNGATGLTGMKRANPDKDWAYPGELAGGIPPKTSPSYRGTRMLTATPKSSPRLQSSEPQSNTNLIITINSIAVDAQRDQGSVTGIVYTIGVSIHGDELVDFTGYLVDAQSNVVATAVSAANAESESVELFFDSRNIFDNYNGGPLTLGRVDMTVDGNYSTNNVIGTLYDFAVEPIEVNKSELLCNKGYILDGATTNDVSASGIAVSIPVLVNVADDYRLEAELVSTNDELVATAFATNYCATGTNVFALTFSSDAIYQNGRSGIHAVKNVQLWCGDEMIDANAVALELTESRDIADFVPSGVSVVVDSSSGRFLEPDATSDGKLSSLRFVFDVTNATETMVGYDVASVLMNTNSEIVASIRTAVAVTNDLNQIEITIPASTIAKSGVNGPYRFESIELLPQGESSCGTTYRPSALSAAYMASDFGVSAIEPCGTPRFVDTSDSESLMIEYSYEALRVGRVVAEVVLADRNGDFAARVITTNDVSEIGVKTNSISIASDDVAGGITNSPYAVACLSLTPDIIGESLVYMDTESLTNIFWQAAAPVFSPATKTVFFKREQTVSITCATDAAEIRYTLDGSEPTDASQLYVGAFTIFSNTTVKAKAFAEKMRPSETVQAEYVHASIVGDNLVQYTSPEHGVAQTVSVPVPGTYQVSFGWTQGGNFELRLSKGGDVRTVVAISAETAGTTNFLFDISAAGDYELTVFDPSAGALQPADVSNLSVSIPNTPENQGRFWIYETEETYRYTGEWTGTAGFKDGKMPIMGNAIFTPYTSSTGRYAVLTVTFEFEESNPAENLEEDLPDCIANLTIGEDKTGENVFKVLTMEHGERIWKSVYAEGLGAPTLEMPYTFKLALDCSNRTYSVSLIKDENEVPLADGTTGTFAFADDRYSAVSTVGFVGSNGNLISLLGNYSADASGFADGDILNLSDGAVTMNLTGSQARWLNAMGSYEAIKAKVGRMEMEDFMVAYLLNLDFMKDGFGLVTFKVTEFDITDTDVHIKVQLNRVGTMQTNEGGEVRNAPINGILKLYGGDSPNAKTLLNATKVTDADFGEGDTATFTYPRSGGAKFFRPVIEVPAN